MEWRNYVCEWTMMPIREQRSFHKLVMYARTTFSSTSMPCELSNSEHPVSLSRHLNQQRVLGV